MYNKPYIDRVVSWIAAYSRVIVVLFIFACMLLFCCWKMIPASGKITSCFIYENKADIPNSYHVTGRAEWASNKELAAFPTMNQAIDYMDEIDCPAK